MALDVKRFAVAAFVAALVAIAGGASAFASSGSGSSGGGGSGGSGSGGATADFTLSANYGSSFVGYVVRGGLLSCPACTTSIEPRYRVTGFTPGWDSNSLGFVSVNGFSGTVVIDVAGLPSGVTSETASSVSVPRGGAVSTPLRLRASGSAAVGTATITVRASASGKTHTLSLPISVVDALPSS